MTIEDEEYIERLSPGNKILLDYCSPAKILFMMQVTDEYLRDLLEQLCEIASIPIRDDDGSRINYDLIEDLKARLSGQS